MTESIDKRIEDYNFVFKLTFASYYSIVKSWPQYRNNMQFFLFLL